MIHTKFKGLICSGVRVLKLYVPFIIISSNDRYLYLPNSLSSLSIMLLASPGDPFNLIHTLQFLVQVACILFCSLGSAPASLCLRVFPLGVRSSTHLTPGLSNSVLAFLLAKRMTITGLVFLSFVESV